MGFHAWRQSILPVWYWIKRVQIVKAWPVGNIDRVLLRQGFDVTQSVHPAAMSTMQQHQRASLAKPAPADALPEAS